MKTKKIVSLALFTALALILSLIESAFPPLAPIPGIKLGLANIITLVVLLNYTGRDAFLVLLVRVILSSLFTGQAVYFLYSLSGALLCFAAMWLVNKLLQKHFVFLTSIVGSIFHNTGQVLMAILLTKTLGIAAYLPILLVSGILTGLFTGLCAFYSQKYLSSFFVDNKNI